VKLVDKVLLNAYPNDFRAGVTAIFHVPGSPKWPDRVGALRRALRSANYPREVDGHAGFPQNNPIQPKK